MKTTLIRPEPVPSAAAPDWGTDPARPARGLARILYVDDDPLLRRLGKLVLVRSGYAVDTADDGAAAWAALNQTSYHLLITDHDMPRLTGRELITQVRRAGMCLPILMTSGSCNPLDDPPGTGSDLTAFLPKPFTSEMLVAIVEQTLRAPNQRPPGRGASASAFTHHSSSTQPRPYGGIND